MNLPPGTLRRIDPTTIHGRDFGTHAPSLGQLTAFLSDCANEIILLGIQPTSTTPGTRLSPPVRATLRSLAQTLAQVEKNNEKFPNVIQGP